PECVHGTKPPGPIGIVHRTAASNIVGSATYVSNPCFTPGFHVTPNWNPYGMGGTYYSHRFAVEFDPDLKQLAIYNSDGEAMPQGVSFNIVYGTSPPLVTAPLGVDKYTPLGESSSLAVLQATPALTDDMVFNKHTVVLAYLDQWVAINQDQMPQPTGTYFYAG